MRNRLATILVLLPSLALAQAPVRPPEGDDTASPRPVRPAPRPPPSAAPGAPRPAAPPAPQQRPAAQPQQPDQPDQPQTFRSAERCVPMRGRFMLQFNKAEISDVLEQASRWTCRNFMFTEDVARGKITLLSKTPVTAEEAYSAFIAALNSNNISVYPTGKYYKLVRTADAKKNPIPTYTGDQATPYSEQPITKVIRLNYADADQLRGIMGNFISPQGADIQSIPPNMLIITDIALNIRRVERLIDAVDRAGAGELVRIVQIRFASAKDIADKVNQIFQAQQSGARGGSRAAVSSPQVPARPRPGQPASSAPAGRDSGQISVSKVLSDDRTNKLIVIADEKSFERLMELIEQLDVPTSAEGGIHVVFLKNANAEELAQTLSNLAQGQASGRRTTGTGAPAGGLTPTPMPGPLGTQPGAPPSARPGGASDVTASLFAGDVKITADKQQNALLIQASGADFQAIQRLVEKLDRPRRQVFVEAVIMEVNLRDETQFGVGAHGIVPVDYRGEEGFIPISSQPGRLSSFDVTSAISLGGFLTGLNGPPSGVVEDLLGIKVPSLGVIVQALQSSADVNVLSTPHILASDNEESEITVGQNVPFQAGYAPPGLGTALTGTTGGGSALGATLGLGGLNSLYAPIQRQNVELRLKIKPQINEGGNVRLTIEEQTEEIVDRDPQLGPTTAKRTAKTQIVAKDQSTIVIGGLIQERSVRSVQKIPVLGSLPILGWLFRDTTDTKQRTNLLLFLTPYIIRDETDYRRIYERKRKEQQEFVEQFYGRQPSYQVAIDFTRKAGPYAKFRAGILEESQKLENGGTGAPGERLIVPPTGAPRREEQGTPGGEPDAQDLAPEEALPGEIEQLEVQPQAPAPGEAAPLTPPAPQPGEAPPPATQPEPAPQPPGE